MKRPRILIAQAVLVGLCVAASTMAATTIGTNIATDGTLLVTGASTLNGLVGIRTSSPQAELDLRDSAASPSTTIFQVANANDSSRYLTVSSTSTQVLNGASFVVGSTNTFVVDSSGNPSRMNGVITNWPAAQGANGTVLTNDGAGNFSWTAPSVSSFTLNEVYNNSTSTSELSLNGSDGPLTIADTVGGLNGNLFEVVDRLSNDAYSQRYLTISATSTQNMGSLIVGSTNTFVVNASGNITRLNNVAINWPSSQGANGTILTNDGAGNLSWAAASGGGITTLNEAYMGATSTSEINLNTTDGSLTVSDTIGGLGKSLLEIVNRLPNNSYSNRHLTVSATGVGIGRTAPTATLDIQHSSDTGGTIINAGVSSGSVFSVDYQGNIAGSRMMSLERTATFATGADEFWPFAGISVAPTSTFASNLLELKTGSTFRFSVKATGNTGILTNSPAAELDVRDALASPATNILTIGNLNASSRYFTVSSTSVMMSAGVDTEDGTGSVSTDAVTVSTTAGVITDSTDVNLDTTRAAITWTNTRIATTSVVLASICSTPDSGARLGVAVTPGNGSATITVYNSGTANQTSDYKICFQVTN